MFSQHCEKHSCVRCGCTYHFSQDDLDFYHEKGVLPPNCCRLCRRDDESAEPLLVEELDRQIVRNAREGYWF